MILQINGCPVERYERPKCKERVMGFVNGVTTFERVKKELYA